MKFLFLLYVICLFIIFTPNIFFNLYKKNEMLSILLHGLLFALVVYISSEILDKKIMEGNTYTLNVNDISSLFGLKNNYDVSVDRNYAKVPTPAMSKSEQALQRNNETTSRMAKDVSGKIDTAVKSVKDEVAKMKKEVTDYKFNAKKSNFICTMELPNFDFSKPQIEANTFNYYNSKTMVPGWSLNRAALMNNSEQWGFQTPYPSGSQAIALQNNASISTVVNLYPGNYFIDMIVSGRDCCDETGIPNSLDIMLNDKTFDSVTPELTKWTDFKSKPFNIATEGKYIITIQGTNEKEENGVVDKSSAIKNIVIHRE